MDKYTGTWALSATLLGGCATVLSPSSTVPPQIAEYFEKAQAQVAFQYPDAGDPYSIEPTDFRWDEQPGTFKCGDVEGTQGCFSPPIRIRYTRGRLGAVWHESGHAILYKLGDYRWRCSFSGHEDYPVC